MAGSPGLRAQPAQAGVGSSSTATTTSATAASPVPPRVYAWRSTAAGTSSPRPTPHVGDGRSGHLGGSKFRYGNYPFYVSCPSVHLCLSVGPYTVAVSTRPAGGARTWRTTRQPASNPGIGAPTCASATSAWPRTETWSSQQRTRPAAPPRGRRATWTRVTTRSRRSHARATSSASASTAAGTCSRPGPRPLPPRRGTSRRSRSGHRPPRCRVWLARRRRGVQPQQPTAV